MKTRLDILAGLFFPERLKKVFVPTITHLDFRVNFDSLNEVSKNLNLAVYSRSYGAEILGEGFMFISWFQSKCTVRNIESSERAQIVFELESYSRITVAALLSIFVLFCFISLSWWGFAVALLTPHIFSFFLLPFFLADNSFRKKVLEAVDQSAGEAGNRTSSKM